jgi:hypothetical protein
MPLGNGDIGLNVWVEPDGDVRFYISRTDAWDENARLLKLGRVRLALTPSLCRPATRFEQTLDTASGSLTIRSVDDNTEASTSLRFWVDANRPVVRVAIDSPEPIAVEAQVEMWRTVERQRSKEEAHCPVGLRSQDERETVYPDTWVPTSDESVMWCHRNGASCWASTLEHQDMASWIDRGEDPLIDRTFGILMRGEGWQRTGDAALTTGAPTCGTVLSLHCLTMQSDTLEVWTSALCAQAAQSDATDLETAWSQHTAWWKVFWDRSWIELSGTPEAERVSRGYRLYRYQNACAGRGVFPIKFNGSIFTADGRERDGAPVDADYRRWGGGYWFQNTRLTYWPMLMSGDIDLMQSWFDMFRRALPLARERAMTNFGIEDAAFFPETMTFWGTYLNENYGYQRDGVTPGIPDNQYIRRYWQGNLEVIAIMLDVYNTTQKDAFLRDTLLVLAPPLLRFYRDVYPERDSEGRMRMAPSQSLETWWGVVNPLPDIAGLQWVLDGLLDLPTTHISDALRAEWQAFRDILPPLPIAGEGSTVRLMPAEEFVDDPRNTENPELYAVFPYRFYGVGKPDLDTALNAWRARRIIAGPGWRQDAIQAAYLGLTDEAKALVVERFSTPHEDSRFDGFYGPNFDWVPDQDHSSVAAIALQRMLMQCDDGAIRLLPAWPREWNATFRLHAPGRTVVEGRVDDGNVMELNVTPLKRLDDLIVS